ncbi:MAG: hypothetical protein V1740_02425 [Candidatus Woesearchaeota archaeon]
MFNNKKGFELAIETLVKLILGIFFPKEPPVIDWWDSLNPQLDRTGGS